MLENPTSLVLLLLLLPVIILYLLKPKPKTLKMPSIMLLNSPGKKRGLRSLFETLIRDPFLLIQLAAITIIVFSLVNPYFSANTEYSNTVIVLDNSASMSATDVSPDRFSQAVDIASGYILGGKSSLILAGSTPLLLFKDAESQKAIQELGGQRAGSTGTDLSDAMLLAAELAGKGKSKIVVISDFSGQDITYAKKTLEAKSIPVDYRQVGVAGSNIGIIDASVSEGSVKFTVKNYEASAKDITIRQDGGISQTRRIKPGSKEFFSIPALPGKNTLSIEPPDDLQADNFLYISMPVISRKRVLILGDIVEKTPISIAFNSIPGVEVEETTFIRAPRKPDHNIIVLHNYTRDSLLPGTMDDLRSFVEDGGTLVFEAQDELAFIDTKGLLPVEISGRAKASGFDVKSSDLTGGLDLGNAGFYEIGDRTIAANLLDEKESDITVKRIDNKETDNTDSDNTESEKTFGTKVEKVHLVVLFSILAIILVAIELYYRKHRGDI